MVSAYRIEEIVVAGAPAFKVWLPGGSAITYRLQSQAEECVAECVAEDVGGDR